MHELITHEKNLAYKEGRIPTEISMYFLNNDKEVRKEYNIPANNDIAIIFNNKNGAPPYHRDILTWPHNKGLHIPEKSQFKTIRINTQQDVCDPMIYTLLFPYGTKGWNIYMSSVNSKHRVTQLQFYSYRLSIRDDFNPLLHAGKLTQQYIVDGFIKIEGNRLKYYDDNRQEFRIETRQGL